MALLLFDLDETLVAESEPIARAFATAAELARARAGVDPVALVASVREQARALWHGAPTHPFADRIGISSWEGLWCRYEGDGPELAALREWAPAYRTRAWAAGLSAHGVDDPELAAALGETFAQARRSSHAVFPDAAPALELAARRGHRLAVLTNGAACLQREKLAASGLHDRFELVVVSGDVGVKKPDPAIFRHALGHLGAAPADATMIGDSLRNDVSGALNAGLGAVWLNRVGATDAPPPSVRTITTLAELL